MSQFKVSIANKTIEIETVYKYSAVICQNFLSDKAVDFCVQTTQDEIEAERYNIQAQQGYKEISDWYIESIIVHRKIAEGLIDFNTFLMHGAVIALQEEAYLFTGKSGTGKTTHILKWLERVPNTIVVNGDKPFVHISENDISHYVYGSPWSGKENLYCNEMFPLKAIILMERAEDNYIERVPFTQAFPFLFQQMYRPNDEKKMRKTLNLLKCLSSGVSFWHFHCNNFKDDCFDTAYNALIKKHS